MLARDAQDISLLDVVEAIDGPITLNECVEDASACVLGSGCSLREVWCTAQEELVSRLRATNFSQVALAVN